MHLSTRLTFESSGINGETKCHLMNIMQATAMKQIADARHALQRAIDEGNDTEADRLMIEVKSLQDQADAPPVAKAHPVSVPATRPGARCPRPSTVARRSGAC
jgi:hypothetical protein